MADVQFEPEQVTLAGLAATYNSIDATDVYFANNSRGKVFLLFKNTGGSPSVVTFDITQTVAGLTVTDPTVSVPATTGERLIGPFPGVWEEAGGVQKGRVKFSQDQATGVTVAVVKV